MIKSRFGAFGFWLMAILSLLFLFLLISAISQYYFNIEIFKIDIRTPFAAHFQIAAFGLGLLLFGGVFIYGANLISINTLNKEIEFKNLITRRTTLYLFNNIDGYVDTLQRDGRGNSYKAIYLVKGNKFIGRISSFFYSNYNELKDGLHDLTYLGFQNFGIMDSFRVLLGKDVLNL